MTLLDKHLDKGNVFAKLFSVAMIVSKALSEKNKLFSFDKDLPVNNPSN